MFSSNQGDSTRRNPLVILSVEGGLVLRGGVRNDALINALHVEGITEVYLLTASGLSPYRTQTARETAGVVLPLAFVRLLRRDNIEVKAVVSTYDLVSSSEHKDETFSLNDMRSAYFYKVMERQEALVLNNPAIDFFTEDTGYGELLQQQEANQQAVKKVVGQYAEYPASGNVKVPLMDLLLASLKNQGVLSKENPRTVLFFDESPQYLSAFRAMADKNEIIHVDCCLVEQEFQAQNYRDFFENVRQHEQDFDERALLLRKSALTIVGEIQTFNSDENIQVLYHKKINDAFAETNKFRNSEPLETVLQYLNSELIKYKIEDKRKLAEKFIDELYRLDKSEIKEKNRDANLRELGGVLNKNQQKNTTEALKRFDEFVAGLAFRQMRAQEKIAEAEEKNLPTPEAKETQRVTNLPSPIVSLIHDYLPTKPTQEERDAVNQDLRKLREIQRGAHPKDWDGISVTVTPDNIGRETGIRLTSMNLDGIVFGKIDKNSPHEMKAVSKEEAEAEFAKLIKEFEKKHRGSFLFQHVVFSGSSLTGAKFENLACFMFDFHGAQLLDASFKLSRLKSISFSNANLQGADFSFCFYGPYSNDLRVREERDFYKAIMIGATLYKSHFIKPIFSFAILNDANLSEGLFKGGDFEGCEMKEANLMMADFSKSKFYRAILKGAHAAGANFTNVNFKSADLRNVDFTGATLTGANFFDADRLNVFDADMTGARMSGAHFDLEQFTENQLKSFHNIDDDARLYIAAIYLNSAQQHYRSMPTYVAELEREKQLVLSFIHGPYDSDHQNVLLNQFLRTGLFPGIETHEKSLHEKLLTVQRFIKHTRQGAESKMLPVGSQDFTGANFKDVNLQKVIFTKTNLTGANFEGADMTGAFLKGAQFDLFKQFSKEQVLSFHYDDPVATRYIAAIYDYTKTHTGWSHKTGLDRAEKLIRSFINGDKTVLEAFLATGKLPGESEKWMFSSASNKDDPDSLCGRLNAIQKEIAEEQQPDVVKIHAFEMKRPGEH
ncbi:MAG TPA: pentapeptide repeat-containing protein [Gammaproteobacteria bacterium]|nr:pentapeptide repeat-containing protein [Gammaproteobacteria bacterium]